MTGKPGILIALGMGKPSGNLPSPMSGRMTNPTASMDSAVTDDAEQTGMKSSREEAQFALASNSCGNCSHWHRESGDCDKVEGTMDAADRCIRFFESARGGMMNDPDAMTESQELGVA